MHWTKLESASIQYMGEDKVIWALCYINNNAHMSHSTFSSWSSPLDPQRKEKKQNNLHGKAPNQQKKNEKSFWVFF